MATPYTPTTVNQGFGAEVEINANFADIAAAFQSVLNKLDATDNALAVDLDFNGKQALNVGALSMVGDIDLNGNQILNWSGVLPDFGPATFTGDLEVTGVLTVGGNTPIYDVSNLLPNTGPETFTGDLTITGTLDANSLTIGGLSVATESYVTTQLSQFVPISGGTFSGNVNFGNTTLSSNSVEATSGFQVVSAGSGFGVNLNVDGDTKLSALDDRVNVNEPLCLRSYTSFSLPDPTLYEGCMIFVTDSPEGKVVAFSDGVVWMYVQDGAEVPVLIEDPFWNDTKLLLNFNGPDESIIFTDSSPDERGIGPDSPGTEISIDESLHGGSSGFFPNGSLVGLVATQGLWAQPSTDFTAEAWIRPTAYPNQIHIIFDNFDITGAEQDNRWTMGIDTGTSKAFVDLRGESGSTLGLRPTSLIPLNSWTHLAFVRSGNIASMYVNGIQEDSLDMSSTNYSTTDPGMPFYVGTGKPGADSRSFLGYIEDARITKAARYTSNFTPPPYELGQYVPAP